MPTKTKAAAHEADGTLIHLDPKVLAAHPANVRSKLGSVKDLVASVKQVGVIEPIIVAPDEDGGWRIIAGHRRSAAAVEAGLGTVPCLVRSDLGATDSTTRAAMLVENVHRERLTAGDEAMAVQQLALGGMTAAGIAKATGIPAKQVKAGLAVAASDVSTAIATKFDVTLDQAAALAEFGDDDEIVKKLTVVAVEAPGRFPHLVQQHRDERAAAAAREALVEEFTAKGYEILKGWDIGRRIDGLLNDKGKQLTEAGHKTCPHRAVVLSFAGNVVHFCLDPEAAGHKDQDPHTAKVKAQKTDEENSAERAEVITNNKLWRSAEKVRTDAVRQLLARKKAPAGAIEFAVSVALTDPGILIDANDLTIAEALGRDPGGLDKWQRRLAAELIDAEPLTPGRAASLLLLQVAVGIESRLGIHSWRQPSKSAAAWFRFLESTGYGLSDIEEATAVAAETGAPKAVIVAPVEADEPAGDA